MARSSSCAVWVSLLAAASALAQEAPPEEVEEAAPPSATEPPLVTAPESEEASAADAQVAVPAPAAHAGELVRVVLADGQAIRGRLVSEDANAVILELVSGGELSIPRALVRAIEEERLAVGTDAGELWFKDVSRTRYFFGPSAMMLKQGEAYFSQKELFLSEVGYAVTDHVTVVAGAVPIAWFLGLQGLNGIGGLKVGSRIVGDLHASAGAYALVVPNIGETAASTPIFAGFGFGTLTYGTPNMHVSVSGGVPFISSGDRVQTGPGIFTLSAARRLTQNVAVVTENWLVLVDAPRGQFLVADGLAVRFLGERFSVDVGGVWTFTETGVQLSGVPIPWVDFTYHFDLSKK